MKVIFIASLAHSGSTLLDLMLNAHPDVISGGELKQLVLTARFKRRPGPNAPHPCNCHAASLWECPLWAGVNEYIRAESGQTLAELNVDDYDDPESFYADNALLFEAMSAVSGKKIILDSSKSYRRLKLLMKTPSLDVFPIYLRRDPRGQIWSRMKKERMPLGHLIAKNIITNFCIYEMVKDRPHFTLTYEDLVRCPESTLRPLMQQLGLEFHPAQLQWAQQERHNVAGNRMRWNEQSELKHDLAWQKNLTFLEGLMIKGATAPVRSPFLRAGLRTALRLIPVRAMRTPKVDA